MRKVPVLINRVKDAVREIQYRVSVMRLFKFYAQLRVIGVLLGTTRVSSEYGAFRVIDRSVMRESTHATRARNKRRRNLYCAANFPIRETCMSL